MAPRLSGVTRASSLGPIATFMECQGGSIARVLRKVDLPFAILEQRELIVPLREQFRLLEKAARDTGDAFFGARLGRAVKSQDLSAFGAWVCKAETLGQAMMRAHAGLNVMLQTSTVLTVSRHGSRIRWSIEFVEPETEGRHHNEFLALGYAIDIVRGYAGPRWRPSVVMTALPLGSPRAPLEDIFGANVSHGHAVPAIEFDASLLGNTIYSGGSVSDECDVRSEPPVPRQSDVLATTAAVTELALHEGYPRIDWVAAKLGTTSRSLQRRLSAHGTSFIELVDDLLSRNAKRLLLESETAVTDIALRLGYSDPAHFTRAFRRWTGLSPSAYRQAALRI
ncbi:Helix-turn-helix domain-containing protein [Hyphomicrobium facile]|uniref:Helix-turn-helix domain-containing protein n=1 Tax=Hyphomicrobium facile TaxID=51670 RepID=A0A1I7NCQ9_9HYPH|nr:Helix-turn-helix domain-containing protein [Hyphomicrobium facile]